MDDGDATDDFELKLAHRVAGALGAGCAVVTVKYADRPGTRDTLRAAVGLSGLSDTELFVSAVHLLVAAQQRARSDACGCEHCRRRRAALDQAVDLMRAALTKPH